MKRHVLHQETVTGFAPGTSTGSTVETAGSDDFVAEAIANSNAGGGTLDVTFEDSEDGTNWGTWITLTQLTAAGQIQRAAPSRPPLSYVRRKAVGVTGTWGYTARLVGHPKV